jgi:hypothetical protein
MQSRIFSSSAAHKFHVEQDYMKRLSNEMSFPMAQLQLIAHHEPSDEEVQ